VAQNTKLADPTLDWATFQSAVRSLDTLYTDVSNAASAVQKFSTSLKPVPAPKPAKSTSASNPQAATTVVAWAN